MWWMSPAHGISRGSVTRTRLRSRLPCSLGRLSGNWAAHWVVHCEECPPTGSPTFAQTGEPAAHFRANWGQKFPTLAAHFEDNGKMVRKVRDKVRGNRPTFRPTLGCALGGPFVHLVCRPFLLESFKCAALHARHFNPSFRTIFLGKVWISD